MTPDQLTIEHAVRQASELGLLIRLPKSNELFIDVDDADSSALFASQIRILREMGVDATITSNKNSKSGGARYHVVVAMPFDMDEKERVLWQALLGSDPKRELLSALALHLGKSKQPTLFFEESANPPEKKAPTIRRVTY